MASRDLYKLLKENEGSNGSISNSGSSATSKAEEENDDRGFAASCPAVLEPSKDKSRNETRRLILLREEFIRSCPQPADQEISVSSSGETVRNEDVQQSSSEQQIGNQQQVDESKTSLCVSCWDCYNHYAGMIRNSWIVYIFHIFVGVLSVSAIVMGILFFRSCGHSFTIPIFNILTGMSGLLLLYKWVAKVCRERRRQYYWNFEKDRLVWFLAGVLFFMFLEFIFSSRMTPVPLQSKEDGIKCAKTYSDYLYYMHITNAATLFLAALLYLPDCCRYISAWDNSLPSQSNGHYQPL